MILFRGTSYEQVDKNHDELSHIFPFSSIMRLTDISVLILVFNAAAVTPSMLALLPQHTLRHYQYLHSSLPELVPHLQVNSRRRRSSSCSSSSSSSNSSISSSCRRSSRRSSSIQAVKLGLTVTALSWMIGFAGNCKRLALR